MIQSELLLDDVRRNVRKSHRPSCASPPVLQVSGISLVDADKFPDAAIRASAFKGFVGMTCFCPMCRGVLDCCSATGVDIFGVPGGQILQSMIFCDRCFDSKVAARVPVALLAARRTHPQAVALIEQGKRYHEKGLL